MERSFKRQLGELEHIFQFIRDSLAENIDPAVIYSSTFIVEELFTNMIKYSPTTSSDVTIGLERHPGSLSISLIDRDVDRFDPRGSADVDTSRPASERAVGGLGIYLVKQMAEKIDYEYADRTSKITVTLGLEKKNV